MLLTEAISQGKSKYSNARKVKLKKALLKPMTSRLFVSIFERQFQEEGLGIPAALTKKDFGMLNHLIKHLSEKLSTQEIADLAKSAVTRWKDEISEHVFNTVEGKKLTFPTRPNLRVVLYCKNDFFAFLTGENKSAEDEVTSEQFIMPT